MPLISVFSRKNICAAIILCYFIIQPQAFAEKISLVSTNWPPYASSSLPDQGLAIHIVKSIFKSANYQSDAKIEQWNRALQGSKIGVYDVVATIYRNETRRQDLLFSEPYLMNEVKFIARKDSEVKYNSLNDLNGLLVGVINDYAYDDQFDKSRQIIKLPANRLTQNLLSVMSGKIDLAVADQYLAKYEMHQFMGDNADKFKFLEHSLAKRGLRIAVSKKNKKGAQIVKAFNQSLSQMQKDGSLRKLITQYKDSLIRKLNYQPKKGF